MLAVSTGVGILVAIGPPPDNEQKQLQAPSHRDPLNPPAARRGEVVSHGQKEACYGECGELAQETALEQTPEVGFGFCLFHGFFGFGSLKRLLCWCKYKVVYNINQIFVQKNGGKMRIYCQVP